MVAVQERTTQESISDLKNQLSALTQQIQDFEQAALRQQADLHSQKQSLEKQLQPLLEQQKLEQAEARLGENSMKLRAIADEFNETSLKLKNLLKEFNELSRIANDEAVTVLKTGSISIGVYQRTNLPVIVHNPGKRGFELMPVANFQHRLANLSANNPDFDFGAFWNP